MAMHLNTYGLMMNGFHLVAAYKVFEKGMPCLFIECYKSEGTYLVRNWLSGRKVWDNCYDNKDEANANVARLLKTWKCHQRTF